MIGIFLIIYILLCFRVLLFFYSLINKWLYIIYYSNEKAAFLSPEIVWEKYDRLKVDEFGYFFNNDFYNLNGLAIGHYLNSISMLLQKEKPGLVLDNMNNFENIENLGFKMNLFWNLGFFNWGIRSKLIYKNYQFMWLKNINNFLKNVLGIRGIKNQSKKILWPIALQKDIYNLLILPSLGNKLGGSDDFFYFKVLYKKR